MEKTRVMVVIGTRPELIKQAPVVRALRERPEAPEVLVVFTGQHRELVHEVAGFFGLEPDVDLELMRHGQSLSDLAGRALRGLDRVIADFEPHAVVVQGDTTSAAMGALAAYHRGVPVAHVEAGLRSGDLMSPFPEEGNRKIIGQLATYNFAPTGRARQNLLAEGIDPASITVTGNTAIDAVLDAASRAEGAADLPGRARDARELILVTMHRRENQGDALGGLLGAIRRVAASRPQATILFPVHPTPKVKEAAARELGDVENIELCSPLRYPEFVSAMARATLILSDSGGVQEEAPALGVPVLVLRDTTERPEGIAAGAARLVGTDPELVFSEAKTLLEDDAQAQEMRDAVNPYGDGFASARIAEVLLTGACASDFSPRAADEPAEHALGHGA